MVGSPRLREAEREGRHTSGTEPHPRVVVIGGGVCGLVAALRISEATAPRCRVVVLEAEAELGGLARSCEMEGLIVDRFYHFICRPDRDYLRLLREMGLGGRIAWRRTRMGLLKGGEVRHFHGPGHLLTYPRVPLGDKLRHAVLIWRSRQARSWKPLEDLRAWEWLRNSIGKLGYEEWWEYLLLKKFGAFTPDVSAAWLMARIRRNARSRTLQLWDRVGHLRGGTGQFVEALAARIRSNGGKLRVSSPVAEILWDRGRAYGVTVRNEVIRADAVVFAGKLVDLPNLLRGQGARAYLRSLAGLHDMGTVCTVLRLRHSLSPLFWLNVLDPSPHESGIIEFSHLWESPPWHLLYIPEYGSVDAASIGLDPEKRAALCHPLLRAVNPSYRPDWVEECRVFAASRAQPTCPIGFSRRLPPARTPIAGVWAVDYAHALPEDRSLSEIVKLAERVARDVTRSLARDTVRAGPPLP